MVYEEVNPEDWTYEKDGDFIEGVLIQKKTNVGPNEAMLYSLEVSESVVKNVWGATILDSRMALVKIGDKIKITYKGLAKPTPGKQSAKLFKVEVDRD